MPLPRHEAEVVVIGAGAAGIAAARRLSAEGRSLLVLEAAARPGGRAWTLDPGLHGWPIDMGCGWLHSADRNPWTTIAAERGFTIDRTPPPWGRQAFDLGFSAADQKAYHVAAAAFYERSEDAAQEPQDRPAADLFEPDGRWNALIDAVGSYINGVEYEGLSVQDFSRYEDSGVNWRVLEGYGAAVCAHAVGLPIAFETPVTLIDRSGPRLRIVTAKGDVEAKAAIVTVSTDVLADEGVKFHPPAPDKHAAAAGLPLGLANKIYLKLENPDDIPKDQQVFGAAHSVRTGSYHLRPFGRPLIEGYFGGALARDLEKEDDRSIAAFAIEELAALLGTDLRQRLTPVVATRWSRDLNVRGSYSYARPGRTGDRAALAQSLDGRIFFAGEACSASYFSTAHGAHETGSKAAEDVLAALRLL